MRIYINVTFDGDTITGTIQQVKCPHPKGIFVNCHDGSKVEIPCNRWDCPVCGPVKKNRVADRVKTGFVPEVTGGYRVRAVTLTQKLGTEIYIMDAWARFRALLLKRGYHLKYFWSKEFTKKGERHLHILVNAYIPQNIIKYCWKKATKGESYVVWITGKRFWNSSKGDIRNPAGYGMKYLTKAYGTEVRFDKKEHRYGFSRNPLFRSAPRKFYPNPWAFLEETCIRSIRWDCYVAGNDWEHLRMVRRMAENGDPVLDVRQGNLSFLRDHREAVV